MAIDDHDKQQIRCRMLGHDVPFSYCRTCGQNNIPCRKIFDCWHETFGIEAFMRENYTAEEIQSILAPPKAKMASLIDLIEQARQSMDKGTGE